MIPEHDEPTIPVNALVGSVVHEIRGALQTITSLSELLERDPDRDDRLAAASRIHRAASRARRFAQDLLDVARPLVIELRNINVREVILDAIDAAPPPEGDSVALNLEVPTESPRAFADPLRLLQILTNLITNARESTSRSTGPRTIALRVVDKGANVEIEVEDDGEGVPPEIERSLFMPFATGKPGGTGLGLWLSNRLATAMGAKLIHERPTNGGARFRLSLLPVELAEGAASRAQTESSRTLDILIIDDDVELLETYTVVLEHSGHRVRGVTRGRDALKCLEAVIPDAIICDVRLPDLQGPEFLAEVLVRYPNLASRIIFATGDAGSGTSAASIPKGAHQLLEKPFELEALERAIAHASRPNP